MNTKSKSKSNAATSPPPFSCLFVSNSHVDIHAGHQSSLASNPEIHVILHRFSAFFIGLSDFRVIKVPHMKKSANVHFHPFLGG